MHCKSMQHARTLLTFSIVQAQVFYSVPLVFPWVPFIPLLGSPLCSNGFTCTYYLDQIRARKTIGNTRIRIM